MCVFFLLRSLKGSTEYKILNEMVADRYRTQEHGTVSLYGAILQSSQAFLYLRNLFTLLSNKPYTTHRPVARPLRTQGTTDIHNNHDDDGGS